MFDRNRYAKTEFLHDDGTIKWYDACAEVRTYNALQKAKESYSNFDYIGSSYTYYINNIENKSKRLHHFFIYKTKQ